MVSRCRSKSHLEESPVRILPALPACPLLQIRNKQIADASFSIPLLVLELFDLRFRVDFCGQLDLVYANERAKTSQATQRIRVM